MTDKNHPEIKIERRYYGEIQWMVQAFDCKYGAQLAADKAHEIYEKVTEKARQLECLYDVEIDKDYKCQAEGFGFISESPEPMEKVMNALASYLKRFKHITFI